MLYFRKAQLLFICTHVMHYYVYVFWKWNWSNRNFVYNYISASHDVRLKIHLLMGCTSEKGFRISVVWNICNIACQSCKNSSPGQSSYFASVHGIQYFERNSTVLGGRTCTVCNDIFDKCYHKCVYFSYSLCLNCRR